MATVWAVRLGGLLIVVRRGNRVLGTVVEAASGRLGQGAGVFCDLENRMQRRKPRDRFWEKASVPFSAASSFRHALPQALPLSDEEVQSHPY